MSPKFPSTTDGMSRRAFIAIAGAGVVAYGLGCSSDDDDDRPAPEANGADGADGATETEARVDIRSGPIRGERLNNVQRYLGIPYAQSIAGRNRFAPPRPVEPWQEVRETTRYLPSAPQRAEGQTPISEAFATPDYAEPGDNCLALNVWAPATGEGNHPVMVWLHGGARLCLSL